MKHPHPLAYAAPPKARPRFYIPPRYVWAAAAAGVALAATVVPILIAALAGRFNPAAAAFCAAFFLAGAVLVAVPGAVLWVWRLSRFSFFEVDADDVGWVLQALGFVLMALAAVVAWRAL